MRRRTPPPPSPLPQLNGVDPVRVRLPAADGWATVRDHLVARLAADDGVIDGMLDAGRIVDATGRPVEMFLGASRLEPDVTAEVFVLGPA